MGESGGGKAGKAGSGAAAASDWLLNSNVVQRRLEAARATTMASAGGWRFGVSSGV